jgi:hypothetical protein
MNILAPVRLTVGTLSRTKATKSNKQEKRLQDRLAIAVMLKRGYAQPRTGTMNVKK